VEQTAVKTLAEIYNRKRRIGEVGRLPFNANRGALPSAVHSRDAAVSSAV